jgi:hypothetical protein
MTGGRVTAAALVAALQLAAQRYAVFPCQACRFPQTEYRDGAYLFAGRFEPAVRLKSILALR